MILAKQLTNNSWVLNDQRTSKSLAIVVKKDDDYHIMGKDTSYPSLESIAESEYRMQIIFGDHVQSEVTEIAGYPISASEVSEHFDVTLNDIDIVIYKKKDNSNILFAAGHYAIKTKNLFYPSTSPKVSTLESHEWYGPFKNKFDLNFELSKLNKGLQDE